MINGVFAVAMIVLSWAELNVLYLIMNYNPPTFYWVNLFMLSIAVYVFLLMLCVRKL